MVESNDFVGKIAQNVDKVNLLPRWFANFFSIDGPRCEKSHKPAHSSATKGSNRPE